MFAFESIVAKNEPETAAFVSIAVKHEPKTAVFASSAVKLEPKRFAADHGSVLQSKKLVITPSVYLTAKLKPTASRFAKEFARKSKSLAAHAIHVEMPAAGDWVAECVECSTA